MTCDEAKRLVVVGDKLSRGERVAMGCHMAECDECFSWFEANLLPDLLRSPDFVLCMVAGLFAFLEDRRDPEAREMFKKAGINRG